MTADPAAPITPMARPDRWQRFLGRLLPWFDARHWATERKRSDRAIKVAESALGRSGRDAIPSAYEQYAERLRR